MLNFKCPKCQKTFEIKSDNIPDCACDSEDWECPGCGEITEIGWYATLEER